LKIIDGLGPARKSRSFRPRFSGPRIAALKSLLRPASLVALLPAVAGSAAVIIARPATGGDLLWCMVGLSATAGLYSLLASYRLAVVKVRGERLDAECRDLARKCSLYLSRARAAEGNVESLALIREIHCTGNVTGRAERFRGILKVVAQTSEAVQAELFTPEGADALPAMSAALRRLADGELFVYFESPVVAGKVNAADLVCRKVEENVQGDRRLLRGEVLAGKKNVVGFATLRLTGQDRARRSGLTVRQLLEAQVRCLDLDPAGADQALEHRQVFRIHDQAGAALTISYPLMAEGVITGAMRLRLPSEALGRRELAEIEELLQETAGHVGLVVKKDEDVQRAKHDGLTGLLLKSEMFRDLREELSRSVAAGGKLSLLMIDIDHFKAVNDTHGHLTGDVILKGVAGCLASHIRSCDRAYRYGGEEMVVVLPGAEEGTAGRTAERLRRAVARLEMVSEVGKPVPVAISIGLADLNQGDLPAGGEELIGRADQALYFSKESGRNRTSVWRPAGPLALPRSRGRSTAPRSTGRRRKTASAGSTRS
jgi:diguanylate cyclase (GGDEF)-like protein